MVSKKKATEIVVECLNEMYLNSDPPISWEEIKAKYPNVEGWFTKHLISEAKYDEIKDKYLKLLPKKYQRCLYWELLSYAPKFKNKGDDKVGETIQTKTG